MIGRIFYISLYLFCFFDTSYLLFSENQIINIEPLNTVNDDFAPSINLIEKTIFYNWSNENQSHLLKRNIKITEKLTPNNVLDIFADKPLTVTDEITKSDINPVYICFWGKEAYFTGKVKTTRGTTLGIYKSIYEKNNWQIARLLDELGTNYFNFHPTISPSGNILVYCSANPTNPDDSDLMIAYRDERNNWSSSVPLNVLNSNMSEISPFFASDDTLYFASNGLDGRGGFDVFYSVFENGSWQKPIPVQGINTEYDESDFSKITHDLFFFVSNRSGGKGGLDIWGFLQNNDGIEDIEPVFRTSLNTNTLKVVNHSTYIQLVDNDINQFSVNARISKNYNFYNLYKDSISAFPSHLEVSCHNNMLMDGQYYELLIRVNDKLSISRKISKKDTSLLIPVLDLINSDNIPQKFEIISKFRMSDKEQTLVNEVEVYKSQREFVEIFEIDNIKYRLIVVPLPKEINNEELEKRLQFLHQEVKYKNSKIIVESSPTFELYDNEKIRSFLNKLNINNNAIIYQLKVNKNLSKYFNNLNFNYLLVYLQI